MHYYLNIKKGVINYFYKKENKLKIFYIIYNNG